MRTPFLRPAYFATLLLASCHGSSGSPVNPDGASTAASTGASTGTGETSGSTTGSTTSSDPSTGSTGSSGTGTVTSGSTSSGGTTAAATSGTSGSGGGASTSGGGANTGGSSGTGGSSMGASSGGGAACKGIAASVTSATAEGAKIAVTVDARASSCTVAPDFAGTNYESFPGWGADVSMSAFQKDAFQSAGIQLLRYPGGAPGDYFDFPDDRQMQ